MKLRVTRRALSDREQIFIYLSERSPDGARNVAARLVSAIEQIRDHPLAGIATDVADIRVVFVGRYPYKIFYRVRDETIEVLHIRHTSRHPTAFE